MGNIEDESIHKSADNLGDMKTGDYVLIGSSIVVSFIPIFFYLVLPFIKDAKHKSIFKKKACVVVIGPLVRSPRMMNHIKGFLVNGYDVEVISQATDAELAELNRKYDTIINDKYRKDENEDVYEDVPTVNFHLLESEKYKKQSYIMKAISQMITLVSMIWSVRSCDYVLVQNPPSIPILPMLIISKLIFDWKVIIDWHNFGYSIFLMKGTSKKIKMLGNLYFKIELYFGGLADHHLVVTKMMADVLIKTWKWDSKYPKVIENGLLTSDKITVCYDYPDVQFQPEINKIENRLQLIENIPDIADIKHNIDITKYTIGVTSTSFTPDEDLQLLLDSLVSLDSILIKEKKKFMLIITGKGPLKEYFVKAFKEQNFKNIQYRFYYLKLKDYPKILQLSDFGISLHSSSSGWDLPMKVWDMIGCGLPCVAYSFPALDKELVHADKTGLIFKNKTELVESLENLIKNDQLRFQLTQNSLKNLNSMDRWVESWNKSVKRYLEHDY